MEIGGSTRILAIIGDPIAQVRTPAIINPLIRAAGLDAVLVPFHVPEARFAEVVGGIMGLANLDGLVVTYPFKERALGLVQESTRRAHLVGAVNAMRREGDGHWAGDTFDGVGLSRAVGSRTVVAGAKVLLIGAGGAGRAIGLALAEGAAAAITVVDLNAERARILIDQVRARHPGCTITSGSASAAGYDIFINATPVGMKPGDGLPVELAPFSRSMTVVDIVPAREPTALLRKAVAEGANAISGSAVIEGQAGAIMEFLLRPKGSATT
ncbi:MAG: shikimate dehydrogenase family protein [Acetobacteraceae bacterium]